jgi:oxygen-independent coproporphyrinogen-3 oxidase
MDFSALEEVTLEANPATFDVAKARLFRELGVTRVSLGIQSFHAPTLKTLGREHDPAQAAQSVDVLRQAELPQINIDLMFSIPGLGDDDWRDTLQQSIDLKPDHISAYNLTYEEDTAFFDSLQRGELNASEDRDSNQFHVADELLGAAGFSHYETSNYARPSCESTHNRGYWQGEDYLGLGPSAVSTLNGERSRNVSDTAAYVSRINSIGHATDESERLSPQQQTIERIALGLRTREGISLQLLDAAGQQRAQTLCDEGMAQINGDQLTLCGVGRALVDPIVAELI